MVQASDLVIPMVRMTEACGSKSVTHDEMDREYIEMMKRYTKDHNNWADLNFNEP